MINFKSIFKTIYDCEDFDFIEQEEDGSYTFYPEPDSKGYRVNSLKELKPLLIYWRLSSICNAFLILTFLIILMIFIHQIIDVSCLFTMMILTFCLTVYITSGFLMWNMRKFKRVEVKSKMGKKMKLIALGFCVLYALIGLFFVYNCPCCVFGHFIENQKWQTALNTINFFIKIKPEDDNLYENRALIKYNLDNLDGAIDDIVKANELSPDNPWILANLAFYKFMKTKKLTPDISDLFEKGIKQDDSVPSTFANRGRIYFLLGEKDKAIKDFEQAYILTGNEYFNYLPALMYEQSGDYCKAFAYYNTVPQNKHFKISELSIKKEYAKFMCKE